MKNIITILFAVLLLAPISVDAKNNTKREINRAVKQKMKEYEMVMVKIVFYECRDVIAMSSEDAVDDFGGWNNDWFA